MTSTTTTSLYSRFAEPIPRVLSIAGSDPSGGAGIQADVKSITAAGGYAMAAITTLTVQNTCGVRGIHTPEPSFLRQQLDAISDDITIDAVKTGMLGSAEVIATVAAWLEEHPVDILVVDPVMVATSGDRLLDEDAEDAMRALCHRATVVTPNIGELSVLTGQQPAQTSGEAIEQARRWAAETNVVVIVKTGHLGNSPQATNYVVMPDGTTHASPTPRLTTTTTHGTGCSLSSALATRLAAGDELTVALDWVTSWLHEAIAYGAELHVGHGNGPVDHSHRTRRLVTAANSRPWLDALASELHSPDELPQSMEATLPDIVVAAGPWTRALWNAGWETWTAIEECDFLRELIDGSLPDNQFRFYLGQDALYLADYSRALATLAVRAPSTDERVFWGQSSVGAITEERTLHAEWLKGEFPGEQSPVTSHYASFLLASTLAEPYVTGAASVLPCFWLYAQVAALVPDVSDEHPYASWLRAYSSPEFVAEATHAVALVEEAMATASPAERSSAARAYLMATRHELEFFAQATRLLI